MTPQTAIKRIPTISALALLALLAVTAATHIGCTHNQSLTTHSASRHTAQGLDMLAQHQVEAALAEFEKAVSLDPDLSIAHSKIGQIHKDRGDYTLAALSYERAVKLDPYSFSDALNLGDVYRHLKSFHAALRAYVHASELDPKNADAQLGLGVCSMLLGRDKTAIIAFEQAVKITPDSAFAWQNLGAAYDRAGKYYEAIRAYRNSLEYDRNQPRVMLNLGSTYLKQDRLAPAQRAFELAIETDPAFGPAYCRLAYCKYRRRDYTGSLTDYNRALTINDKLADAHAGLGIVRMTQYLTADTRPTALRDRALEDWHRSLELNPDQPKLLKLLSKYQPATPPNLLTTDATINTNTTPETDGQGQRR